MLNPFDATLMRRYPVSTRVNFVKNDDPECAAALERPRAVKGALCAASADN
jgi:hypothetical protein